MGWTVPFHGHRVYPEPWLAAPQTHTVGPEGRVGADRVLNLLPTGRGESASAIISHNSVGSVIREHNVDVAPPGVVHTKYVVGFVT